MQKPNPIKVLPPFIIKSCQTMMRKRMKMLNHCSYFFSNPRVSIPPMRIWTMMMMETTSTSTRRTMRKMKITTSTPRLQLGNLLSEMTISLRENRLKMRTLTRKRKKRSQRDPNWLSDKGRLFSCMTLTIIMRAGTALSLRRKTLKSLGEIITQRRVSTSMTMTRMKNNSLKSWPKILIEHSSSVASSVAPQD